MCTTCGCGHGETKIEGVAPSETSGVHVHADGTVHSHAHEGDDAHPHAFGQGTHWRRRHRDSAQSALRDRIANTGGPAAVHAEGLSPTRIVAIERDILAKNDEYARRNRRRFRDRGLFVLNLVSSPGSGKTSLLVRTIAALQGRVRAAVIEGDQQTTRDADRIRATGAPAIQINTGKGCHLDAQTVGQAFAKLPESLDGLLFIENVGNLVCPAAFDLGEAHKIVILSVTEGEDKPLKYPDMFQAADLLLVNKVDLAPYVEFDIDAAIAYARRVRPGLPVMRVSATTGEGLEAWIDWLIRGATAVRTARDHDIEALQRRIGVLESELARHADGMPAV
jgi:hydrogenase nickel incorporation protein HypB